MHIYTFFYLSGIVYAKPRKGFQFSPQYQLSITAEDSFKPPKVSPNAILFVRVSTIPRVLVDNVNLGSYQFQATILLKEFAYLQNVNKLQVLVQRYAPSDSSCKQFVLNFIALFYEVLLNVNSISVIFMYKFSGVSVTKLLFQFSVVFQDGGNFKGNNEKISF